MTIDYASIGQRHLPERRSVRHETQLAQSRPMVLGVVLIAALVASACTAEAPPDTDSRASAEDAVEPPSEDELYAKGYVHVPGAMVHASCIHQLAGEDRVEADGSVLRASGRLDPKPQCDHPAYRTPSTPKNPQAAENSGESTNLSPPGLSGWTAEAYSIQNIGVKNLWANWIVPEVPSFYSGQLLYIFTALEPVDYSNGIIIQPVLQFGKSPAGGGSWWALASWYLIGNTAYHTGLIPAAPGDWIQGTMDAICNGSSCWWNIKAANMSSGAEINLGTSVPGMLGLASVDVLEVYQMTDCTNLPTGTTTFWGITLYDAAGVKRSPSWPNHYRADDCYSYTHAINTNFVTLIY